MSIMKYAAAGACLLVLSPSAMAQDKPWTTWSLARIGLGYETSRQSSVLGKPLTLPNGESVSDKLPKYPSQCFNQPGITKIDDANTKGDGDFTAALMLAKLFPNKDNSISLSCGNVTSKATAIVEVSEDGRSWHVVPVQYIPSHIANHFYKMSARMLVYSSEKMFISDNEGYQFTIRDKNKNRLFSGFIQNRRFYAIIDSDQSVDQRNFIQNQLRSGRSAESYRGDRESALRTRVDLGPMPDTDIMSSFRRVFAESIQLYIDELEVGMQRTEKALRRKYSSQ